MDRDENRALSATAANELARLRAQLAALGDAETRSERVLGGKGARLSALNAAEADLSARMGRNQAALSRLLGALQLYRRNPPPALLVSPRNATDAVNAAILLKAITPGLEAKAKAFAEEARSLQSLRRTIVLADSDVLAAESEAQDRRTQIRRLISEKSGLERAFDKGADLAAKDARRLAGQAVALGGPGTLGALEGADVEDAPPTLRPPVRGAVVRRFRDVAAGRARSEGWTYRTLRGEGVFAPADGRVDYAGALKGWGVVLILRTMGDYHLVLAGLSAANVPMGAAVTAGEPIGRMAGAAGVGQDASGAPELYLEVRKGETPVDPARWLDRATARGDHEGVHRPNA
jgi:septal ring factor EnvC (AmiA/AmiB activator)